MTDATGTSPTLRLRRSEAVAGIAEVRPLKMATLTTTPSVAAGGGAGATENSSAQRKGEMIQATDSHARRFAKMRRSGDVTLLTPALSLPVTSRRPAPG